MARWKRGPFGTLEELHESIIETLLDGRDERNPNQLIKLEVANKDRTTVIIHTGVIERLQLTQSGGTEALAIFFGAEDSVYLTSERDYIAGITYHAEVAN